MLYRVFDGHCDTPVELWLQEKQLRSSDLAVSLDKAAGLGGYAQFFAFCTAWIKTRMPHTEHFSRALDYFLAQLRREKGMTQKELAAQKRRQDHPLPHRAGGGSRHAGGQVRRLSRH